MEKFSCENSCCLIKIKPYHTKRKDRTERKYKAGIFIYDPKEDKILLVQSRGNLWGPPKGTLKEGETDKECAVREVNEETGLVIDEDILHVCTKIHTNAMYFFIEKNVCDVEVQEHLDDNDANGITWIRPKCLLDAINNEKMSINYHCKVLLQRFLSLTLGPVE
jgi:8-oxo-dGTP pyrophosphatase MutT (NUDIX family)